MNQKDQNIKLGDFRQSTQVFASVYIFCKFAGW